MTASALTADVAVGLEEQQHLLLARLHLRLLDQHLPQGCSCAVLTVFKCCSANLSSSNHTGSSLTTSPLPGNRGNAADRGELLGSNMLNTITKKALKLKKYPSRN